MAGGAKPMDVDEEETSKEPEAPPPLPDMDLAQWTSQVCNKVLAPAEHKEAVVKIIAKIKEKGMYPYWNQFCVGRNQLDDIKNGLDAATQQKMQEQNAEELKKLDAKIEEAKEQEGETEVKDAWLAKAEFFARIGDKAQTLSAYEETLAKTVGAGGRLDVLLTLIRLGFFFEDKDLVKTKIAAAKEQLEKGGDWERKNKLKVYEAVFFMMNRNFTGAAHHFLDVMPTFTALELLSYEKLIFYAIITTTLGCDRGTMRKRLVHSPEVLQSVGQTPYLKEYMMSYYTLQYKDFFGAILEVHKHIKEDRYLIPHLQYYMRVSRAIAYRQYLTSFKSVTVKSMAEEFGVTEEFIDEEVANYIDAGKLHCKIDKVSGIIESTPTDNRNQVYKEIIREGDTLLNKMTRLAAAVEGM